MKHHLFAGILAAGLACAAHGQTAASHDLATVGLVAPPRLTLSAEHPSRTKPVVVFIQNRGAQSEVIPDAASLAKLVVLEVQSLGSADAPVPALVPRVEFPIVLHPRRKLPVVFSVTFDRANDPARTTRAANHDDFRYTAVVHREALDQVPDVQPGNDAFPRDGRIVQTDVVLAPSFPGVEPAANAPGSSAAPLASPLRTRAVSYASRAAVFTRLTATPMTVSIKKGQTLSDPILFTAIYTGAASGLSWGPGDAKKFSYPSQNTFRCQWDKGGDHTVTAYIFDGTPNPPHKSITIQVISVQLQDENGNDPTGLRIGVTTPSKDRSRTLKAIVDPASLTSGVTLRVSRGGTALRLKNITPASGTITFQAEGFGTTGSKAKNDCTIEADVSGKPAATANVSVVVPAKVASQSQGPLGFSNVAINQDSTPSAPSVPRTQVMLATRHGWLVTVEVRDQFGDPIGDANLYLGARVSEDFGDGTAIPINRSISANSNYGDPVGLARWRNFPGASPRFGTNATEVVDYLGGQATAGFGLENPAATASVTNTFDAIVDGFTLKPSITRTITLAPGPVLTLTQTP